MLPRPCYSIIAKVNSADQFILLANTSEVCIILSVYIVARWFGFGLVWSGLVYCTYRMTHFFPLFLRFFIIMAVSRYCCSNMNILVQSNLQ